MLLLYNESTANNAALKSSLFSKSKYIVVCGGRRRKMCEKEINVCNSSRLLIFNLPKEFWLHWFFFLIYSRYVIIYLWFHISICDDVAAVILWQSNEQLLQELLTFSILLFCLDAEAYKIEGNPIKLGRQLLVWIVSKKMTGEKMKKPVKLEVFYFSSSHEKTVAWH